eukprot:6189795-Pleurochrysis_carterae.AAC.2
MANYSWFPNNKRHTDHVGCCHPRVNPTVLPYSGHQNVPAGCTCKLGAHALCSNDSMPSLSLRKGGPRGLQMRHEEAHAAESTARRVPRSHVREAHQAQASVEAARRQRSLGERARARLLLMSSRGRCMRTSFGMLGRLPCSELVPSEARTGKAPCWGGWTVLLRRQRLVGRCDGSCSRVRRAPVAPHGVAERCVVREHGAYAQSAAVADATGNLHLVLARRPRDAAHTALQKHEHAARG